MSARITYSCSSLRRVSKKLSNELISLLYSLSSSIDLSRQSSQHNTRAHTKYTQNLVSCCFQPAPRHATANLESNFLSARKWCRAPFSYSRRYGPSSLSMIAKVEPGISKSRRIRIPSLSYSWARGSRGRPDFKIIAFSHGL